MACKGCAQRRAVIRETAVKVVDTVKRSVPTLRDILKDRRR